jgi:hypothetical protein
MDAREDVQLLESLLTGLQDILDNGVVGFTERLKGDNKATQDIKKTINKIINKPSFSAIDKAISLLYYIVVAIEQSNLSSDKISKLSVLLSQFEDKCHVIIAEGRHSDEWPTSD